MGDLTQKIKSYPISHDAEINTITGTKYIHYGDIHTGKLKRITNEKILPNINDNNYIPLKSGDVIVADASEDYKGIADACVIDLMKEHYKIVSGLHTIVFRPNERLKSDFLYTYFHTPIFKHYGYRVGTGLKVFGITYNNLSNMEIKLPKIDEQNKVYKIINIVTNIITLQQRKLKLLNKLKKGLINNILSSVLHFTSTKSVEHIVTFGDIFNYERPDNYIVSSENYVSSGIPVLTANKSFILGYSNENHPYNKGKAIIFDDFTLESKLVNFNFMVKSSAIKILTTKPSYDIDFCFVLLKNTPLIQEGHARHYISRVQPTKVKVPNLTLQRKYAKIFNTLEYKIRNSNSIQENLKLLKQFLLQNMFI